jgi:hypothetical protein
MSWERLNPSFRILSVDFDVILAQVVAPGSSSALTIPNQKRRNNRLDIVSKMKPQNRLVL